MRSVLVWLALLGPALASAQIIELLSPRDDQQAPPVTSREFFNVLGRTTPGAVVHVGGEAVTVFATGVFARDRVPLAPGLNQISIEAALPGAAPAQRVLQIERVAPPAAVQWPGARLFVDGASLRPDLAQVVAPGETVEVSVRATAGQRVTARLPGQRWAPLTETTPGRYRAALRFGGEDEVAAAPVQVRIEAHGLPIDRHAPKLITVLTPGTAGQWRTDPERLFAAGSDGADLLHGLHDVRLGGPFLAELPAGTLLQASGRHGEHLRVQLSPDSVAWVAERQLQPAVAGTARPQAFFTTLSVAGSAEGDVVNIPLAAPVPYAVRDAVDAAGRHTLEVEIYGAHHATTWISHRASSRLVREVSVLQAGPGRVLLRVLPHAARLWGWRVERTATALRIVLRGAPGIVSTGPPLAGLHIAVEAGHGSADNLGAVGATGVPEKDINRWTAEALQSELEAAGATVTVVRVADDNPDLRQRARRVLESQAMLFVSIHANSADTGNGFLRVSGTSMYYKHAISRDLAAAVQRRLLDQTGLPDFGLVGNFNYTPIRLLSWMPAVLVEQAFVSHPGDEAQLLDPAFRARLAKAVRAGIEDFLRSARPPG